MISVQNPSPDYTEAFYRILGPPAALIEGREALATTKGYLVCRDSSPFMILGFGPPSDWAGRSPILTGIGTRERLILLHDGFLPDPYAASPEGSAFSDSSSANNAMVRIIFRFSLLDGAKKSALLTGILPGMSVGEPAGDELLELQQWLLRRKLQGFGSKM